MERDLSEFKPGKCFGLRGDFPENQPEERVSDREGEDMKKTYKESCLIELKIGDKVQHIGTGRVGVLRDIKIVPNTRQDVIDGRGVSGLFIC